MWPYRQNIYSLTPTTSTHNLVACNEVVCAYSIPRFISVHKEQEMPGTYKIGRPEWRSTVRVYVEVRSPSGATALVRYDYVRPRGRGDKVVKTDQNIGTTLKDLGISRAQVVKMQDDVLQHCRRLTAATKKKQDEREELKELRAIVKAKKKKLAKTPKEQLSLI
jgi:hypothetical protein